MLSLRSDALRKSLEHPQRPQIPGTQEERLSPPSGSLWLYLVSSGALAHRDQLPPGRVLPGPCERSGSS
jgi:hypothetical protein